MSQRNREKLLEEAVVDLKKYLRSAKGKSFDPSIYEWRRIDDLYILIREIKKITDEK